MDITFISDTHGLHPRIKLNPGTILVHSGDVTEYGTEDELVDFLHWFSEQPFKHRIFIGGNHDLCLEASKKTVLRNIIPSNVIYLKNSGVELEGLKFWGSPVTPWFLGMAFNARTGMEIKKVWQKIPLDTDILITHGPPLGILDNNMGDNDLLNRIQKVKPLVHCFGHIHGTNGSVVIDGTRYINTSMVSSLDPMQLVDYRIIGKPGIFSFIGNKSPG